MTSSRPDLFNSRYSGLVNRVRLAETPIDIIGCGTIGRPLALILAAMGAERLSLYDPDVVSAENLGNQGWRESQIGLSKVTALSADMQLDVAVVRQTRVTPDTELTGAVRFYCVDSVGSRRVIAGILGGALHIDGRIGGEKLQIVCAESGAELLPTIPETDFELPCGKKSTLYIGHVCAGLMVSQFVRWMRAEKPLNVYQNLATGSGRWGAIL